jgi:hypothetical protein
MRLAADLENADVKQHHGTLFAVGYASGALWFEYSRDRGDTQATFANGDTRRKITEFEEAAPMPSVEAFRSREFVVFANRSGAVYGWYSLDGGETWTGRGS